MNIWSVKYYYDINRGGLTGSHIYVEDEYIRAAVGGTGFAKVGGNYAGGMSRSPGWTAAARRPYSPTCAAG